MFSPFRHSGAIIISQQHCSRARLAPLITACKHFSGLSLIYDVGEERLVRKTRHVNWSCAYTAVALMCLNSMALWLHPLDPKRRKRCFLLSKLNSLPFSVTKLDDLELLLHGLDLGYLTDIMTVSTVCVLE